MAESPMECVYCQDRFPPPLRGVQKCEKRANEREWLETLEHRSGLVDTDAELNGKIRGIRIRGQNGPIPAKKLAQGAQGPRPRFYWALGPKA